MLHSALILAALHLACPQDTERQTLRLGDPDRAEIRALLLIGGGYHAFEPSARILAEGLVAALPIHIEIARLDAPPRATIAARPELLADPAALRRAYDVVLAFTQDQGLALNAKQREGYLAYVREGGRWIGMHCALDTFKTWGEYIRMSGGTFESHPPLQDIHVFPVQGEHPILAGIENFTIRDEFYYLKEVELAGRDLLLAGPGPTDARLRPVAWTRRYGRGRVFATILGHGPAAHGNANFQRLIANAIRWSIAPQMGDVEGDGWITLFDGRSLAGWTQVGPGHFSVDEGALLGHGGMGMLWFDRQSFADFTLELEWKAAVKSDNSGIFLRFPDPPRSPWDAVHAGYEIQICDAGPDPAHRTGSVYGFAPTTAMPSKATGEWNRFAITVKGQHYTVALNGETICEYEGERGRRGYVGLQNHDDHARVWFRDIRVKPID